MDFRIKMNARKDFIMWFGGFQYSSNYFKFFKRIQQDIIFHIQSEISEEITFYPQQILLSMQFWWYSIDAKIACKSFFTKALFDARFGRKFCPLYVRHLLLLFAVEIFLFSYLIDIFRHLFNGFMNVQSKETNIGILRVFL